LIRNDYKIGKQKTAARNKNPYRRSFIEKDIDMWYN